MNFDLTKQKQSNIYMLFGTDWKDVMSMSKSYLFFITEMHLDENMFINRMFCFLDRIPRQSLTAKIIYSFFFLLALQERCEVILVSCTDV